MSRPCTPALGLGFCWPCPRPPTDPSCGQSWEVPGTELSSEPGAAATGYCPPRLWPVSSWPVVSQPRVRAAPGGSAQLRCPSHVGLGQAVVHTGSPHLHEEGSCCQRATAPHTHALLQLAAGLDARPASATSCRVTLGTSPAPWSALAAALHSRACPSACAAPCTRDPSAQLGHHGAAGIHSARNRSRKPTGPLRSRPRSKTAVGFKGAGAARPARACL